MDGSNQKPIQLHPIRSLNQQPLQVNSSTKFDESPEVLPFSNVQLDHVKNHRWRLTWPTWSKVSAAVSMFLPLFCHVTALALAVAALLQQSLPYMSVQQIGNTGKISYGITSSCAIAPNSTIEICGRRSLNANFLPSVLIASPGLPEFSSLHLPFHSSQTPIILTSGTAILTLSLLIYFPLWLTLFYHKSKFVPRWMSKFVCSYPKKLYMAVGILAFASMIITLTGSMGYGLLMSSAAKDFIVWINIAQVSGQIPSATTKSAGSLGLITAWVADTHGPGFSLLYLSVTLQAIVALSINIALHCRMDERLEWMEYGDDQQKMSSY